MLILEDGKTISKAEYDKKVFIEVMKEIRRRKYINCEFASVEYFHNRIHDRIYYLTDEELSKLYDLNMVNDNEKS